MTRSTPENPQETASAGSSETIRQPSRTERDEEMVLTSGRLEDGKSEIPCRVDNLPSEGVIPQQNLANNGEALAPNEWVIPWEVGSGELLDPVTTEAKAEMAFTAMAGKSKDAIRRQPFNSRIHLPSYISGYVDGEGCFCVSLRPQPRIRVGWEVRPSFSVSQNDDRAELVRAMPLLFGCGSIRPDRSDKTVKFEVRSLKDLLNSVIPFFEELPLLSNKRKDFECFQQVCRMMSRGLHLTATGIELIAEMSSEMNSSGTRRYTIEMIKATVRR